MKTHAILLLALITVSQAEEHPRILSGIAFSKEQADALGFIVSSWPTLSRGDKLLLESGDKRILFEIVAYTSATKEGRIDENATVSWMTFNAGSVTTGSKKLVHQITATKNGDYLRPEPEKIDGMTFSWRVDNASGKIVFDIPVNTYYTLIRSETLGDSSSPH